MQKCFAFRRQNVFCVLDFVPKVTFGLHWLSTLHLADAFIQSDLQTKQETSWSNVGVKGLAQGPNSCADLIVATPGIEPPTMGVQVK